MPLQREAHIADPDGFFADNPQEFFASIANQWFCDSAKTVELGAVRFAAGRRASERLADAGQHGFTGSGH